MAVNVIMAANKNPAEYPNKEEEEDEEVEEEEEEEEEENMQLDASYSE